MKALSIKQPWAWLVVNGHKDVENRTWPLPRNFEVPQRIYVHAGKQVYRGASLPITNLLAGMHLEGAISLQAVDHFWNLWRLQPSEIRGRADFGAIIGEVTITGQIWSDTNDPGVVFYEPWYEAGMHGFTLSDPVAYDKPIPCKGQQGLWTPKEMEVPS